MSNIYANFTEKILDLPLWVKEILYSMLRQNLQEVLPCSDIDFNDDDLYQHMVPQITYAGKKEYERLKQEDPYSNEFKFLDALVTGKSIVEITLNNVWTLEETSSMYCDMLERQFAAIPENQIVLAKAAYLGNRIRIGEYFKKIGKIDVDQLEAAMRIQKESEMSNEKKGFASILVDMNLVTRNDTDNILMIKQESKKRFVLDFNSNDGGVSSQSVASQALSADKYQLERLMYENNVLKVKLRELLNIQQ